MRYYVYNGQINWFSSLQDAIDWAVEIGGVNVCDENDNVIYRAN